MMISTMSPSAVSGSTGGPFGYGIGDTVFTLSVQPILLVINIKVNEISDYPNPFPNTAVAQS